MMAAAAVAAAMPDDCSRSRSTADQGKQEGGQVGTNQGPSGRKGRPACVNEGGEGGMGGREQEADTNERPTRGREGPVTRTRESTRAVDANERPSRREGRAGVHTRGRAAR